MNTRSGGEAFIRASELHTSLDRGEKQLVTCGQDDRTTNHPRMPIATNPPMAPGTEAVFTTFASSSSPSRAGKLDASWE
jgi:hypothetical protein